MSIVELSFLSPTHAYFSMRVQLQRLFEHWRSTWEVEYCVCPGRHGKKTDILDLFWHFSIKLSDIGMLLIGVWTIKPTRKKGCFGKHYMLRFMLFCWAHCEMRSMSFCKDDTSPKLETSDIVMSSTYFQWLERRGEWVARSLIIIRKRIGPNFVPWGTRHVRASTLRWSLRA